MKRRTFSLELSDDDMRVLLDMTASHGTTPEELLQGFVCDLIGGTHTHGSDERELAAQYFSRCGYGMEGDSFIANLLKYGGAEHVLDTLDYLDDIESDLAYYATHPEEREHDAAAIEGMTRDTEEREAELNEYYESYCEAAKEEGTKPQEWPNALEGLQSYRTRLRAIRED